MTKETNLDDYLNKKALSLKNFDSKNLDTIAKELATEGLEEAYATSSDDDPTPSESTMKDIDYDPAFEEAFAKEATKNNIVLTLHELAIRIHETAQRKGWWRDCYVDPLKNQFIPSLRNTGEAIALMHSELSEALEGHRMGNPPSDKIPDYSSMEEELADCIIRILDYSHANDLKVPQAILAKMEYNESRPFRHGGKSC